MKKMNEEIMTEGKPSITNPQNPNIVEKRSFLPTHALPVQNSSTLDLAPLLQALPNYVMDEIASFASPPQNENNTSTGTERRLNC